MTNKDKVCSQSVLGWGRGLHFGLLYPRHLVGYFDSFCSYGNANILHHCSAAYTDHVIGRVCEAYVRLPGDALSAEQDSL